MNERRAIAAVGLFDKPDDLLAAVPKVRRVSEQDALGVVNAYTPYPVHGLDRALALPRSPLGVIVFCGAVTGVALAFGFQSLVHVLDYPLNIGGKPPFAWPAFIPVTFEVMVLLSAFTAFFGMLGVLNRLPYLGHPLLFTAAIREITRDRFGLVIAGRDFFDFSKAEAILKEAGAASVEPIYPAPRRFISREGRVPLVEFGVISAVVLSAALAGWAWHWIIKTWPEMPWNSAMRYQAKLSPFEPADFFEDGKAMRTPPAGTVPRGFLPYPFQPNVDDEAAGRLLANPLPAAGGVLQQGRLLYETYCMVCHGPWGDGEKQLSNEYMGRPANFQSARIREMPDGRLFHVITVGKGQMSGYETQLEPTERWAVVHWVRVLQRAQNASDADVEEELKRYYVAEKKPGGAGHE